MRILFYYSSNKRTIPIDIPLRELQKRGHQIFLLTICEKGVLHTLFEEMGAEVYTHTISKTNPILWHYSHIRYLRRFCTENKIDVVHSHLQQANLIATLAAKMMRTKVVLFRHHGKFHHLVDEPALQPHRNEVIADRLINRLADTIVVPSEGVRQLMMQKEHVKASKLKRIPYIYDFDAMSQINQQSVKEIRAKHQARLLLIMVSRLTSYKRPMLVLPIVHQFIREGFDIKMMIMDDGPEWESIRQYIQQHRLETHISLLGFHANVLEYIAAADVLVHPSLTEASNSAVKEAGLLQKAVIVCRGVGDFDDYIRNGENGYAIGPADFAAHLPHLLRNLYRHPELIKQLGEALQREVTQRFRISNEIVDMYEHL